MTGLLAEAAQRATADRERRTADARYGQMSLSAEHAYVTSVMLPEPYGPDVTVFGPPGAVQQPFHGPLFIVARCPCGVSWRGLDACWACGGTAC